MKFIDQKNHRTRTVILDNGTSILLVRDTSRSFEEISVGNSVRKIKNNNCAISGLLEPLIIIFLGLVVGVILIAMYLPMFQMSSTF